MTTNTDRISDTGLQAGAGAAPYQAAAGRPLWKRALYLGLGALSVGPGIRAIARGQTERAAQLLARVSSGDEARLKGAASAALRGARGAEARGALLQACRYWLAYQLLTGDTEKALTNARRCARNITSKHTGKRHISRALQAWRLVATIDPRSQEAKQGIGWCHAGLARWAESDNDFAGARLHWSKAVEVSPRSREAVEGLQRSLGDVGLPPSGDALRGHQDIEGLVHRLKKATSGRSASHAVAGQLLLQVGAPEKAVDFLLTGWNQKPGKETAISLFSCLAALGRFEEAAELLQPLVDGGVISAVRPSELSAVLTSLPPRQAAERARNMVGADGAERFAPLLLPLLLRTDDKSAVLGLVRLADPESSGWTDSVVLETAAFLDGAGEKIATLRLLALFSDFEKVRVSFLTRASAYEPKSLEEVLLSADDPRFGSFSVAVAESLLAGGDTKNAIRILRRVAEGGAGYPVTCRKKERLSDLVLQLLALREHGEELAGVVVLWLPKTVSKVFRGKPFETLLAALSAASRFHSAPETSRLGVLRENYFDHHLERREEQLSDGFATELGFGEAAIRYFEAVADMRSAETTPVPRAMNARLGRPFLPFGDGHSADLLMSCALLRESVRTDLRGELLFEETGRWFLDGFMRAHGVPSMLIGPDLRGAFNAASATHAGFGVTVTRFAELLWEDSPDLRSQYDLEVPLDALLFSLEIVAAFLPTCLHYRELLAGMLPSGDAGQGTFADACIAELADLPASMEPFTSLLSYRVPVRPKAPEWIAASDKPQDVLLIGHGGAGTGLSRNLRMLQSALDGDGVALTTLIYELQPAAFAEALKSWRSKCQTPPVVVVAVNAHDLPSIFIRDRHEALEDCHVAGFFLWETSKPPRVQQLGIRLVDEVWAPTRYVGQIYAPFAPVHVVGKGLFPIEGWPANRAPVRGGPLRFLTVFDFHSSIERKNPLAVVLAFQKAFPGDEQVELVVKASNVNPQHSGNASGQWERIVRLGLRDHRIKIVTERYSERQMQELMTSTACVISLHRSEGFAYVLADAMAVGIPVISTAYSGNVDFCDDETSFSVPYRLVPVEAHGTLWEDEFMEWAEPDIEAAAAHMRTVFENYPEALRKAAIGRKKLQAGYSAEIFAATLRRRLDEIRMASPPSG